LNSDVVRVFQPRHRFNTNDLRRYFVLDGFHSSMIEVMLCLSSIA
jgi:hypothetical protein